MCLILNLYEQDLGATWVQVGVVLGCLESSWHAKRQALNLKRKTSNSKLCTLADVAYKACVLFMVLKCQRASDIENTCIAEMRKSLSPCACAAKSLGLLSISHM